MIAAALFQDEIPPQVMEIIRMFFTTVVILAFGIPIIRIIARRLDRGPVNPSIPVELTSRLERIEQGVEAMAIEIERISEGQRFTTKLLAEQHRTLAKPDAAAAPKPAAPDTRP
jgi:hypothetical protein